MLDILSYTVSVIYLNSFVHELFNIPFTNKPVPTSSFMVNIFRGLVSELEIVVIWRGGILVPHPS